MASLSTSELKKSVAAVLQGADLTTLSSKQVRKKLEDEYDTDFSDRKEEIDEIIMAMITAEENDKQGDSEDAQSEEEKNSDQDSSPQNSESEEEKGPPAKKSKSVPKSKPKKDATNDVESDGDLESEDGYEEKRLPPKKPKPAAKRKPRKEAKNDVELKSDSVSDKSGSDADVDDEALARKLQEEERNSRSRAVKKNVSKKEPTKRSNKSNDKPRKESAYSRKCALSADLANVVGAPEMARHDVVKKMWSVVRERNLFDPKNKQFALCDEQLQKVFGARRVHMFGMMKYLKNHIRDQH